MQSFGFFFFFTGIFFLIIKTLFVCSRSLRHVADLFSFFIKKTLSSLCIALVFFFHGNFFPTERRSLLCQLSQCCFLIAGFHRTISFPLIPELSSLLHFFCVSQDSLFPSFSSSTRPYSVSRQYSMFSRFLFV